MPKYVFECQTEGCSLRFERNLKMGEYPSLECPECHAAAPRVLEQEGFAFAFAKKDSAPVGNTGVHKDDYPTADQIVGRDAESRWQTYGEIDKVKKQVREVGGTHALFRRQGKDSVDYEPMSEERMNNRRNLVKQALRATASQSDKRGR